MLSKNIQTRYDAHQRRLGELDNLANTSSSMHPDTLRTQVNRLIGHMKQLGDDILELSLKEREKLMTGNDSSAPRMLDKSLLENRFGTLEHAYQELMTAEYAVIHLLNERRQLYEQLHHSSQRADGRRIPLQHDLDQARQNTTTLLERCLTEMDGLAMHFRHAYNIEPTEQSLRQLNAAQSIQQALMTDESFTVAADAVSDASLAQHPPTSTSIMTVSDEGYVQCKEPVMNQNYRLVTRDNTPLDEHNKTATPENTAFYSRHQEVESLIKTTYQRLNQAFIDDVGPTLVTDGQLQLTDGGQSGFQGLCVVSEDGTTRGLSMTEQQAYKHYHHANLQTVANAVFEHTGLKANIRVKAPPIASTPSHEAEAGLPEAVASDLEERLTWAESIAYKDSDSFFERLEDMERSDWPEAATLQFEASVQAAERNVADELNDFLNEHPDIKQNPAHRQAVHQVLRARIDNKRNDYGLECHNDTSFNHLMRSTSKPEEMPAARQFRNNHQSAVQRLSEADASEADTTHEHRTSFKQI